ncbi:unnamed protein product [Orchesella dallaii]|uniref:Uncharacterized protein n=1 Tax=Orchesella dallaii TaxID=48710 RepID=A0ABP1R6B6_9HEXA
MAKMFFSILLLEALNMFIGANSQLGVLYSPFVTHGDDPHSTRSYSLKDVKVMLNLLQDDNFHHVSTHSVGAPDEQYLAGLTINKCSSIAETALAAAEINKEKNKLALTVYQGVSSSSVSGQSQQKLSTEIETAFEILQAANKIYDGTVTGLVLDGAGFMMPPSKMPSVLNAIVKSRAMNLTFGMTLPTCKSIEAALKIEQYHQKILDELGSFDFFICPNIPTPDDYSRGPGPFKESITKQVLELENVLKGLGAKAKFYIETGWASGLNSSNPYELVEQKDFWEMMGQWANAEKRIVFMYEAFDLMKHLDNEKEYSMDSYVRKISKINTHNAHPKEDRGSGKPRNNDASGLQAKAEFSRGILVASFALIGYTFKLWC